MRSKKIFIAFLFSLVLISFGSVSFCAMRVPIKGNPGKQKNTKLDCVYDRVQRSTYNCEKHGSAGFDSTIFCENCLGVRCKKCTKFYGPDQGLLPVNPDGAHCYKDFPQEHALYKVRPSMQPGQNKYDRVTYGRGSELGVPVNV